MFVALGRLPHSWHCLGHVPMFTEIKLPERSAVIMGRWDPGGGRLKTQRWSGSWPWVSMANIQRPVSNLHWCSPCIGTVNAKRHFGQNPNAAKWVKFGDPFGWASNNLTYNFGCLFPFWFRASFMHPSIAYLSNLCVSTVTISILDYI